MRHAVGLLLELLGVLRHLCVTQQLGMPCRIRLARRALHLLRLLVRTILVSRLQHLLDQALPLILLRHYLNAEVWHLVPGEEHLQLLAASQRVTI